MSTTMHGASPGRTSFRLGPTSPSDFIRWASASRSRVSASICSSPGTWAGPVPYVDYYAARLWEDVLEMVSVLAEPVPADLVDFVAGELSDWSSRDNTPQAEAAGLWHADHSMYTGPLRNAPHIRLWRTIIDGYDAVNVDWKHQPGSDIGFAAPATGRVVVPASSFDAAVSEFDSTLLATMDERVTALEATGAPPGVDLDLRQLRHEQRDRAAWLQRARARQVGTDWAVVRAGARELLAVEDARRPCPA